MWLFLSLSLAYKNAPSTDDSLVVNGALVSQKPFGRERQSCARWVAIEWARLDSGVAIVCLGDKRGSLSELGVNSAFKAWSFTIAQQTVAGARNDSDTDLAIRCGDEELRRERAALC